MVLVVMIVFFCVLGVDFGVVFEKQVCEFVVVFQEFVCEGIVFCVICVYVDVVGYGFGVVIFVVFCCVMSVSGFVCLQCLDYIGKMFGIFFCGWMSGYVGFFVVVDVYVGVFGKG